MSNSETGRVQRRRRRHRVERVSLVVHFTRIHQPGSLLGESTEHSNNAQVTIRDVICKDPDVSCGQPRYWMQKQLFSSYNSLDHAVAAAYSCLVEYFGVWIDANTQTIEAVQQIHVEQSPFSAQFWYALVLINGVWTDTPFTISFKRRAFADALEIFNGLDSNTT